MKAASLDVKKLATRQDLINLDGYGVEVKKLQNERIYTPEQVTNAAFYLKKGFVRLVNKQNCMTKIIGAGDFFGDRSIFFSEYMYAQALTSIEYMHIDELNFQRLMGSDVRLAMEINTNISKHYVYLQEKQNLFVRSKELFTHIKRDHSLIPLLFNRKEESSICLN
ncbi:cyclic nucleotide-binding domain-containing protein [Aquibacillus saliphilus]|uniref:cyclic nucleotide-binding domain-containing protein n=1 Tax=Aquibacillus saliphilus TaxID=1909422 RepID=UPI001CF0D2DF|nr:cyclic nucleotide-binding domain-containing protein [Aquibacillus saliphilus]